MKYMTIFIVLISFGLLVACEPSPSITISNSPTPKVSASPEFEKKVEFEKKAEFKGYPYTYKREGDKTAALFVKRFLPRDDDTVVGAIRDVIRREYKEEASGSPHLVEWNYSGNSVNAIRIDGTKNAFVTVLIK